MNSSPKLDLSPDPPLPKTRSEGLVIRKYGGSSLATPEMVNEVAADVAAIAETGDRVVLVVSAMGDSTDRLIALAGEFAEPPAPRELDQLMATGEQVSASVLAMALAERGVEAVSLSGDQAGIEVAGEPGAGTIVRVDPGRILARLRDARVIVVAGFQGRDADGELLTLGRGGSDTTAVALAAALGGSECEIRTDVHGVRTADPRIVRDTRVVRTISYDAMVELAGLDARVLHPRSVELARRHGVAVRVTHASDPGPSTVVTAGEPSLEGTPSVIGIAHERDVRLVRVEVSATGPDHYAHVLTTLAGCGVRPDNLSWPDPGELRFTVRGTEPLGLPITRLAMELEARSTVCDDFGSVSVIGTALLDSPGFVPEMLRVLADHRVTVPAMTTSQSRLTAVIPADGVDTTVRALHDAYGLAVDRT
ncbi:aspartate kinase [Amycolatopsis sp. EV170708-02-1]|uniref:aspartate kinase n=1 Tax=Amycolatopsis sp. EV170708-02-1 TaxID=2919322 RepID=UPI001F0BEF8A|nr:aspartate kinase [Amycolatopsis sp. EV170708-02-1]UMP04770.1 aspartate kinase [Amycolatopsis sp. EV170708-02-1]